MLKADVAVLYWPGCSKWIGFRWWGMRATSSVFGWIDLQGWIW